LLDDNTLLGSMTFDDAQSIRKSLDDISLLIAAITMPDETGLSTAKQVKNLSLAVKDAGTRVTKRMPFAKTLQLTNGKRSLRRSISLMRKL
jgi:hypothetical protein